MCCLVLVVGCQTDTGAAPATVSASVPVAASQSAANSSWFTALASAEASITAQVATLTAAQQADLARQWSQESITGAPDQTARARWVSIWENQTTAQAANTAKCQALADDAFPQHFGVGQTTAQYVQENADRQNMLNDCMAGRLP